MSAPYDAHLIIHECIVLIIWRQILSIYIYIYRFNTQVFSREYLIYYYPVLNK
jgi:hypothetical protein